MDPQRRSQILLQYTNYTYEGDGSREVNSVDSVIYIGRISVCMERKYVGEFLAYIKKEFGGGDKETIKVAELKRLEQRGKMMEEFIQEFRRVARAADTKRGH